MTLSREKKLDDFRPLSRERKVKTMLFLAEELIPTLRDLIGDSGEGKEFENMFEAFSDALFVGRRWLNDEISDPDEITDTVYNFDGSGIADQELDHENSKHFADIRLVSEMLTTALLYAAKIQFERIGDLHLPEPVEGDFTDDELVDGVQTTLSRASPNVSQKFDEIWEARFRPANGSNGF